MMFRAWPSCCTAIGAICALLLTCCQGPKDASYNPSHYRISGTMLPAGMLDRGIGVFAQKIGGGDPYGPLPYCCLIASRAQFHVLKMGGERTLHVGLYADDVQRVAISFPGFGGTGTLTIQPGWDDVSVAVPEKLERAKGRILVRLECPDPGVAPPPGSDKCQMLAVYFE